MSQFSYHQRQELEYDRGPQPFDGMACRATLADLSPEATSNYQHILGSRSPELMLRARSLLTPDHEVTVAAELLFGSAPQFYFPSAYIRILHYIDNDRGSGMGQNLAADGDLRIEGSLVQQIEEATRVLEKIIPSRRALNSTGHFGTISMIPRDAWLEGLVNAVVHRSYSMSGDHIRIEVFPSRVEITSPGRFPGLVDPRKPLDIARHARNPRIARVFADLGITQELGEGIRRIFDEMRRQGLTDPIYEQTSHSVRLTLRATDSLPEDVKEDIGATGESILNALRNHGDGLSTGEIIDVVGVSRPTALRYLHRLQENRLISSTGKTPRDPRARWKTR
ncbi:helix-turn-helix domain-containing protein [Schaalia sp. ZJ405]|uniref:ATP-binding protein n=1 Tax=unclassified Schaalia TaxID=2691889 RepID=UPI0013EACF6C|nr:MULTISPECIES: ATP-binding protein [unclassified Schaalia]QPK81198.1 helix-turn-helix domain-containing protein [Schaalia sp. ZJ405]